MFIILTMPKSVFLQEVGYTTLKEIWREFKEKKIVVQTRVVGKAKMYRLNIKNPVVNKFIDYYWAVVESVVEKKFDIKDKEKSKEDFKSGSSIRGLAVSARGV